MKSTNSYAQANGFSATSGPPILQDEGTTQGAVRFLNCTGAGISCSRAGAVGTLNVTGGGGGGGNFVAVNVDFGVNGNTEASTVVTGQAWVTTSSIILCSPTMVANASRLEGMEDPIIEGLTVAVHSRVAGTGFTVSANGELGRAIGIFTFHCTGA